MKQIITLFMLCLGFLSFGQNNNLSTLKIDQIMQGEDFVGYLPDQVRWSADNQHIYFSWNPDKDTLRSTYSADVQSGDIRKLSFDELKSIQSRGDFTKDFAWKVYDKQGDLFLVKTDVNEVIQLTNTIERESNAHFSGDESAVIYSKDNNLFSWNIATGTTTQLTNFTKGSKKEARKSLEETWLENDQMNHFEILQLRKDKSEARKYRYEMSLLDHPGTVYIGSKMITSSAISPDLRYVVYSLMVPQKQKNTIVPDYVTASGYTEDLNARSKVGGSSMKNELWILDIEADTSYMVQTKEIEGIYDKPEYLKDYASDKEEYEESYKDPRDVYVGMPLFSENGKAVLSIISSDHKDRWIMGLDLATANLKLLDRQHDEAWIGGPGVGWFGSGNTMGWIDEDHIWYNSEKTGYTHLYSTNVNTAKTKALTKGEFEVLSVQLSRDKQTFFLTTNEKSAHEHHFYHMDVKGGKRKQITTEKGGFEVSVSPDESQLAMRYSYSNKPWELYVMPNEQGAAMVQLTESTTEEFNEYPWRDPEIINFEARDGAKVPACLYEPDPAKKNGAAVIFVHGAGYLQNVHYWWPSYYREFMFHNILADNGYTVLDIDFRASAGYGRDWRTAIYRHMGGKDLDDQVDGAAYLVDELGISADKIGIYGGSYGGFITLMALFNSPGTFAAGAALRSVTDWAHYNHYYTSNILNTPVSDSLAYMRSSPIYFAEGFEGKLLMLHGMTDTNVHFQDVVRLSQRLIELKKENWELAVFPMEGHSFQESSSWSDEYRRIFKLFQETLK